MIPIELTIEGIYSYQERQTIDFTDLTATGLFGIFGATGSGKSSVLEAISYALYGQLERLNQRDSVAYNMLNLKADRGQIEFVFLNQENQKYRVECNFRRNRNRFDDVKMTSRVFYEWENEEWVPSIATVEEILGLSYSNFKRTIIIPQGQFQEFLELGDKERTAMLEEVFELHRFDLQFKASRLFKESDTELQQLLGKLGTFDDVTEETLAEQEKALESAQKDQDESQTIFNKIEEEFQKLQQIKTDFEELTAKKEEFAKMKSENDKIKQLEAEVEEYETVLTAFSELLKNEERLSNSIQKQNEEKTNVLTVLEKNQAVFKEKDALLKEIAEKYENLSNKRIEESDLGFIAKILTAKKSIRSKEEARKKAENEVKFVEEKQKELLPKFTAIQSEIEKVKKNIIESSILLGVSSWFMQKEQGERDIQTSKNKIATLENEIKAGKEEIEKLGYSLENYADSFEQKVATVKSTLDGLNKRNTALEVQTELAKFSHDLHDGKACPLCGSGEHPHILEVENVEDELKEVAGQIAQQNANLTALEGVKRSVERAVVEINSKKQQLAGEQKLLTEHENALKTHQTSFVWKDFNAQDKSDFESKKSTSELAEKTLKELNSAWETLNKEKEKFADELKVLSDNLGQLRIEEAGLLSEVHSNTQNIKQLILAEYENHDATAVLKSAENLKAENDALEKKHQDLTKEINALIPVISAGEATRDSILKTLEELNSEKTAIIGQIEQKTSEFNLELPKIKQILSKNLDLASLRKKITDFKIKFNTLTENIKVLEDKLSQALNGKQFDLEGFEVKTKQFQESKLALEAKKNTVLILKTKVKELAAKFKEKKELLKESEQLSNRVDGLSKLLNLFSAKGFVSYVSSIYLKQLVDNANVRFHRMTKNQLSLIVNDKNQFEVIDYLNEGRTRSAKTLSGGQVFQVSLSLALALAESVQAKSKTKNNFFFIDEGFGTQDSESVSIVFETLLNLNKENKIVGIISHVEELKERVPSALVVVKDDERGSLIR